MPVVLGRAYHTTNWSRHTFSNKKGQDYPGHRLLWDHSCHLHALVSQAADFILFHAHSEIVGPERAEFIRTILPTVSNVSVNIPDLLPADQTHDDVMETSSETSSLYSTHTD